MLIPASVRFSLCSSMTYASPLFSHYENYAHTFRILAHIPYAPDEHHRILTYFGTYIGAITNCRLLLYANMQFGISKSYSSQNRIKRDGRVNEWIDITSAFKTCKLPRGINEKSRFSFIQFSKRITSRFNVWKFYRKKQMLLDNYCRNGWK